MRERYFDKHHGKQPVTPHVHTKVLSENDFTDYYKDLIDTLIDPILDEAGVIIESENNQYLISES
jgi:hypothetical protein